MDDLLPKLERQLGQVAVLAAKSGTWKERTRVFDTRRAHRVNFWTQSAAHPPRRKTYTSPAHPSSQRQARLSTAASVLQWPWPEQLPGQS